MDDESLRDRFLQFREGLLRKEMELKSIAAEATAISSEAAFRQTGLRPYPEQIMGVHALLEPSIAELATGEGKTLVTAIASCVGALEGRGMHVATVNSYLAERDFEFARPLAEALGMSVGLIESEQEKEEKRKAYQSDITYGTGYEFGFDYLRDQLALLQLNRVGATTRIRDLFLGKEGMVSPCLQGHLARAIVDEMDSVLLDEAGSPLVIAQAAPTDSAYDSAYTLAHEVALDLVEETDYELDRTGRSPKLLEAALRQVNDEPRIPWNHLRRPWRKYITNALAAIHGYRKDEHYIIKDEKIVIVDEFTGRAHEERTWQNGLHQAVDAAEGLPIQPENESAASITRQRYFRLYENLSGLTGTAAESAREFRHFFQLRVRRMPEHRPSRRTVLPDRIFRDQESMLRHLVSEVEVRHATRQPILIGTRTVRMSEMIFERMQEVGLNCRVLNAAQDEEESDLVARAGDVGGILIATNMAGRGTHIPVADEAIELGGLHVVGVERNESIRIDRQLMGRGARQGQPGSFQFFLSTEDHLFESFSPAVGKYLRLGAGSREELGMQAVRMLRRVQRGVEKTRYTQRLSLARRDQWIDDTRSSLA